jgi:hypothetical protein
VVETLRIGEILVSQGIVTEEQIEAALERARIFGLLLGQALVLDDDCTEENVADALALMFGLERIDLSGHQVDAALFARVRRKNVERLRLIPIETRHDDNREVLIVATAHPENLAQLDDLRAATGMAVEAKVATESDISEIMTQLFGRDPTPPTHEMRFLDVVIHQFAAGTDQALLLQEGRLPAFVNERRAALRPGELGGQTPLALLTRGHHRTLEQYHLIRAEDLERGLLSLLTLEQMDRCRRIGGITAPFRVPGKGMFEVTVRNYRRPEDTNPGGRGFTFTARIDRMSLSAAADRSP